MAEIKDEELRPFGWAPGGYTIACSKCPGGKAPLERWGAKRSWRCREHAVEDLLETRRRVREINTPNRPLPPVPPLTALCRTKES